MLQDALEQLRQTPPEDETWGERWHSAWTAHPGDDQLIDVACDWLASAPAVHEAWASVWQALWRARTQGEHLLALGQTWLESAPPEHAGWAFVWLPLWRARWSDPYMSELACTWLATTPPEHHSWKYVWLPLWKARRGEPRLVTLACNWLVTVSPAHRSWAHVWLPLWRARRRHPRVIQLALDWLAAAPPEHGSWKYVWLPLWRSRRGDPRLLELAQVWLESASPPRSGSRASVLRAVREWVPQSIFQSLQVGAEVEGVVRGVESYGVFVELEPGVDGLVHAKEISWTHKDEHLSQLVKRGDRVRVVILGVDIDERHVSLSIKRTRPDPYELFQERHPIGAVVEGRVRRLQGGGASIVLAADVLGMVPPSEMAWVRRFKSSKRRIAPGQEVRAVVLGVDVAARHVSLSIKRAQPNPYELFVAQYPVGSTLAGVVENPVDFGVFVALPGDVVGLLHVNQMPESLRDKHPSEVFRIGQEIRAVVVDIAPGKEEQTMRISLGLEIAATPDA